MSVVISCCNLLSIVRSVVQPLFSNGRFSVIIWVDKVEVNVRVAAFCLHMGPDHIFLGKTKMKYPIDDDKQEET